MLENPHAWRDRRGESRSLLGSVAAAPLPFFAELGLAAPAWKEARKQQLSVGRVVWFMRKRFGMHALTVHGHGWRWMWCPCLLEEVGTKNQSSVCLVIGTYFSFSNWSICLISYILGVINTEDELFRGINRTDEKKWRKWKISLNNRKKDKIVMLWNVFLRTNPTLEDWDK